MLRDSRKDCMRLASYLGDYQKMSVDELANGYCEAFDKKDSRKKDQYAAALILRFWYKINKIYLACRNIGGFSIEDAYDVLFECIAVACQYRKWQQVAPSGKQLNAQQCIQQCIATRGAPAVLYSSNHDCCKANVNALSLDAPMSQSTDDESDTFMDFTLRDTSLEDNVEANAVATAIVQAYVDKKKIIEAIMLDTIAFTDCNRDKKVKKEKVGLTPDAAPAFEIRTVQEFWEYKCVQNLTLLPTSYPKTFMSRYRANPTEVETAFGVVKSANKQKLYRYLRKMLSTAALEVQDVLYS